MGAFEIDANGILNVSAKDNNSGIKNNITITNENGRLSQAETDRILQDAKEHEAQDKSNMAKLQAKNNLEKCCLTFQNMLEKRVKLGENLKKKFEDDDKEKIQSGAGHLGLAR